MPLVNLHRLNYPLRKSMRSTPFRASSHLGMDAKSLPDKLFVRSFHSPRRPQMVWGVVILLLFCPVSSRIAQAGNDFNSGQSPSAPWLSPNHPLNCGDVIMAAASTSYSSASFYTGKWEP